MMTGLDQLTDSALAYLSLEDLLSELLDRIRAGVHADTAAILLLDEERNVLLARAAKGIEEEVRQGVQIPLGRGFAGRIASERRAIAIEDVGPGDVVNPLLRRRGIRSLLGVPLVAGGGLVGVLHVGTLEQRRFTEDDAQLLQVAADRAALAIDNAQLAEQRATTELLQRTLLPEALPEIDGLRLSAKYLPAASGVKLGGDWYDVFRLPDKRVAFVIGDVVGRGIVAASVMAEVRTALRAYLMESHALPAVIRRLNDLLVAMGRGRSATASVFLLEEGTDELRAVSAGHLPALLLPPGEPPRFVVEAGAPPLGVHLSPDCATCTVPFVRGSALVLYTDGLVERRDELIDDQLARFAATVGAAQQRDGLPLADRVFEALSGDLSVEDDVALLAIESFPEPAAGA
jgi:serine phosphatase RsbU (regulator of sigma subunit)